MIRLATLALALAATHGQAATYYIDTPSGNDFRSIRYANSRMYYPGDQVLIKTDTVWEEPLEITGEGVTVSSFGTGATPVLHAPIKLTNASGVTVSNLKIQSSSQALIVVSGGSNNTVTGCVLVNGTTFPVHVSNSPGFRFLNNTYSMTSTFKLVGDVLRADGRVTGLTVGGNHFTTNSLSHAAPTLYIIDIRNALVYSNVIAGGSQAVGVKGSSRSVTGTQVYSNTISGVSNALGGDGEAIEFTGVWSHGPYTVSGVIHNNTINGTTRMNNAIGAFHGTYITAYSNTINGPVANAGFHWSSSSTNGYIHDNRILGYVPHPIVVLSGSSAKLASNSIIP